MSNEHDGGDDKHCENTMRYMSLQLLKILCTMYQIQQCKNTLFSVPSAASEHYVPNTALQEYHVRGADIVNSRFEEAHPIPDDDKDFVNDDDV